MHRRSPAPTTGFLPFANKRKKGQKREKGTLKSPNLHGSENLIFHGWLRVVNDQKQLGEMQGL